MIVLDAKQWAELTFGSCKLSDQRRTNRLVTLAEQVAARPDGSTPDQTETWAACKATYRLFSCEDVRFEEIIAPHCHQTREQCQPGDTKLLINDTTEISYGKYRQAKGLGPTGKGSGKGFFLHSAMMMDAQDGRIEGLAGQVLFYRKKKSGKKKSRNSKRRSADRESVVWGNLTDQVGTPPEGVKWVHVNDRGSDDFEVFCRIREQSCSCVIRAARLNRNVFTADGRKLKLKELLGELPCRGTVELNVRASKTQIARTAVLELRYGSVTMPVPKVLTPWLKENRPSEPLQLFFVELRESTPPAGATPLHWVLYTFETVSNHQEAEQIIRWYERRPQIEDYHKALKTGCKVEQRFYRSSQRLERVTGLLSIMAIRLMQLKTAADETPERPAKEVAPAKWVHLIQVIRRRPVNPNMTIREFIRALAGLGGHLGRKCDGRPGWITLWRGIEKLTLIDRGFAIGRNKCG